MVNIRIKKGLDIPAEGAPSRQNVQTMAPPNQVSLNLAPFEEVKFKLLVKVGDTVKTGQPLAEDKRSPGRYFVSPGSGKVAEIRRGLKRRLLDIIVDLSREEMFQENGTLDGAKASREKIIEHLMKGGVFAHIRSRPFDLLADPKTTPKAIFVKAIESAPFAPPAELQVEGYEREFQAGLDTLARLTKEGCLHLVYRAGSECKAFTEARSAQLHTAEGPHPVGNHSVHIQAIDPIRGVDQTVWTLGIVDVIAVGKMIQTGHYHTDRVVSVAGPALIDDQRGYFKTRAGVPMGTLLAGRNRKGVLRLISGDPLTGQTGEPEDFLGFYDHVFTVIFENTHREMLHFFRLGGHKFSNSGAYLSGFLKGGDRQWEFDTNMHGEERSFVDGTIYDEVQPLRVPTMHLVKAILAEDFETAEVLGGLEVASEDFALPTFVCPCKVEMVDIMKTGLRKYCNEVLAG